MRTTYYDAIISDVDMPSLDGISFYKEAHKNEPNLRDRFIFLTGSDDDIKQVFIKENDLHYLKKPVDLDVLQKAVRYILSNTKPRE